MKLFFVGLLLCFGMNATAQTGQTAREYMVGSFKYCGVDGPVITMKKNKAVEKYTTPEGQEVIVKSKIKWLSDNKYQITFVKIIGKDKSNEGISVICFVKKIKDGEVELTFTYSTGQKSAGCLKKIE